jgi:hypothetical protein
MFGFDFVIIHMLWLVNDFIEFGCYDILCLTIFKVEILLCLILIWETNYSVFIKIICSFKSVQVCLNHGMDSIRDSYAKPQPIDSFDWNDFVLIKVVCPFCHNKLWILLPIIRACYDFIWINFHAGLNWSIRGMNRLLCQHSHNDWNDLVEFMFPVDKVA